MSPCPACAAAVPTGARFCPSCGAAVGSNSGSALAGSAEERRVVSVLFVDLVGFTERSDNADPEDVRRTLVPFHQAVTRELERFGGTLDKFIGDAVMGVFGAPVAHEDDPVRAVRAALSVLESIAELKRADPSIAVRIAVNTGEAVVTSGSGPRIGEAVAGDVVNTASRMQAVADRDGVVVGDSTRRSCRGRFVFQEMPPVAVKGKAEPLRVWRVLGERPEEAVTPTPRFIGRTPELDTLLGLYREVERDRVGRVAALVADPGVGKTALIGELHRRLGSSTAWLAGRCAPYGEGVTFRAMADVVRAEAGIEPTDDAGVSVSKLHSLVASIEPSPAERDWLAGRLEPLLGLDRDAGDSVSVSAPESAAAWSRLVEWRARAGAVVVCFEDLHWAEPALLEMVGHAVVELGRLPVLFLCSMRPASAENADRAQAGMERATILRLSELTKDEASTLLDGALASTSLPRQVREAVLSRSGGNPLFALEFAHMLSESTPTGTESEIPVPDSVQALIAARLDAIPSDLRGLVQDASVVGTTFWPGVLVALSGLDESAVHDAIDRLRRRDLIHPDAASSFLDEAQFGFVHALIREVAYARMPRLVRAKKHRAAGDWLEQHLADRAGEWAEVIANHFQRAATLAALAQAPDEFERARGPAVRWSLNAADRAVRLDQLGAFLLYDRALELEDSRTAERAKALMGSGLMGRRTGRLTADAVLGRFEEARDIEGELGDPLRLGDALVQIGSQLGAMGETARSRDAMQRAVAVLGAEPPSRELARACAFIAEDDMFGGRVRESLAWSERALALAHEFGSDDVAIMALHIRGDARCSLGEHEGVRDLERALALSEALGNAADTVTSENYLAEWRWALEGPGPALAHDERALEFAARRGVVSQGQWTKAHSLWLLFELGEWDRLLRSCDELLAIDPDRLDRSLFVVANLARARLLLLLGREGEATSPMEMLTLARPMDEMQVLVPALVVASEFAQAAGDRDGVRGLLGEFEEATRDVAAEYRESHLAGVVRRCISSGERRLAERLVEESDGRTYRDRLNLESARAVVAEAAGRLDEAATAYLSTESAWGEYGYPLELAFAAMGGARCLVALGREAESIAASRRSASTFDALGVVASRRA